MSETKTAKKNGKSTQAERAAKAIESLINSTQSTSFGDVKIDRRGEAIILPEGMSYEDARHWLHEIEEAEETEVSIDAKINCYPLDGALALYKVLMEVYGHVRLTEVRTFFGKVKPRMVSVPVGVGQRENIPWGRMTLPGIEGWIQTGIDFDGLPAFVIGGEVKRKHEGAVKAIIAKTEQYVKENSIYRGKAIRVNLDHGNNFDPVNDAPQFFDVQSMNEKDLILNQTTTFDLQVSIWNRLEHEEDLVANGVNLKHGTLLMGTYGTGKTMTAKVTAKKAEENGWTFLYIESPRKFSEALRLAEVYAPAVVFCEDIDKVMEGSDRDDFMNRVLNTMDGVDTKATPIITVLTTNHPERINKAFLRAGRIDSVIPMGRPDEKTAARFVSHFLGESLKPKEKLSAAGKVLAGFVPAFIDQAVEKAKQYTISREGRDIKGKVTAQDVISAAETLKSHQDLVNNNQTPTKEEKFVEASKLVTEYLNSETPTIEDMSSDVDVIRDDVKDILRNF